MTCRRQLGDVFVILKRRILLVIICNATVLLAKSSMFSQSQERMAIHHRNGYRKLIKGYSENVNKC